MNNKIGLIIKREYLTRVRNRSFILSTLLLPLFFVGFIAATTYFSIQSVEKQHIAVNDESGDLKNLLKSGDEVIFDFKSDVNATNFTERGYNAFLFIPPDYASGKDSVRLVSSKQLGIGTEEKIRNVIDDALRDKTLLEHHIDKRLLDSINNVKTDELYHFSSIIRKGGKSEHSNAELSYMIGFGSGFLIYLTLFIYGAAVMRGVMEEKTNRIAEVIISSVRPFQLMLGKILGIAAVGITQLLIWFAFILILLGVASFFLSPDSLQHTESVQKALASQGNSSMAMQYLSTKTSFLSVNWALILPCFLFYFIGGYLFYASLFAAVGSVVNEDPQEAQALMIPITMPILLSFIIMVSTAQNPDGPLAVWGSIIPFSSPIVMMARIPGGSVPFWQLALSIILLIAGFIFTTYVAGKIYRTGILLYGKKVTIREMGRWLFRRS